MANSVFEEFRDYLSAHQQELQELLFKICTLPSPSWQEKNKAEFCKSWLEQYGAQGVYIDEAYNVIYPYGCEGKDQVVAFSAHIDTVFPMDTPLAVRVEGDTAWCPSVGDDSANVAILLMCARYALEHKLQTRDCGVLFVCDAGEEGLGNLKGMRKLMEVYGDRMKEYYSIDGGYPNPVNKAVGSTRYQITIRTEGGHSYGAFGSRNAIQRMAALIEKLYTIQVPRIGGSKTTYNVGAIEGGTSINTIAQEASMLFEYRSDSTECLELMKKAFDQCIREAKADCLELSVEVLGQRPCGNVDPAREQELTDRVLKLVKEVTGEEGHAGSGSTDCNIPLSMGIPAIGLGGYKGVGSHTREEHLSLSSMEKGSHLVAALILQYLI